MSRQERVRAGWAGVLISAALLSACGGGGGDSTPPAPPPPTGVAIPDDMAIKATATTDVAAGTVFTSSVAATAGLTYLWTFGDGTTSTEASPKHDFAKVGDYAVSLKVTNAAGTSKEVKFNVTVNNRAHVQGLNCTSADSSGWCWQAPRPTGSTQNDFAFIDANNGWSVGDNGEILRTRDAGKTWTLQSSGVTARLTGVSFTDANNGWVAGEYGALLRTTDGGTRWTLQSTGTQQLTSPTVQTVGSIVLLSSSSSSATRMSADGGATWTQGSFGSTVQLGADGVLWSFSTYQGLSKSTDQGKSSSVVLPYDSSTNGASFHFAGKSLMVVTNRYEYIGNQYVYSNKVQTSADNGQTWTTIAAQGLPTNYSYASGLTVYDASTAVMLTNSNLYRTIDGGRNWTVVPLPVNQSWINYQRLSTGAWMRNYYDYSVSTSGQVYEVSDDAGASWNRVDGQYIGGTLKRVDAKTWVSRGYGGVTALSTDGMRTWTRIGGPDAAAAGKTMLAFWFFDAKRGLALTTGGDLVETLNGGLEWKTKVGGLAGNGYYYGGAPSFQFIDAKKGWLQAADGKLYLTDDGGASWVTPLQGATRSFTAFHFVDATTGFALITDSGSSTQARLLMATTDGGKSWTQQSVLDIAYRDLKFSSALKGVLISDGGTVSTTADGGKTWIGRYVGTSGGLRQLASSEPGTLWLVGTNGLLKSSKDDGATWQSPAAGVTSATLNAIRFLTPQQGWAVGEGGTVLTTVDGGKTWSSQFVGTQRSLSQVFFVDARTGWIAGEGGTLLATGTGGL